MTYNALSKKVVTACQQTLYHKPGSL